MTTSFYAEAAAVERGAGEAALCTVVRARGSVPRRAGSKMLVYGDGRLLGTIGGGEMEARVMRAAREALASGAPQMLRYQFVDPAAGDPGVCGGEVEVYVEPVRPQPNVLVIGGGHVGRAVVHLAKWLGFRVALSDDRPEYCTAEWAPGADEYLPLPAHELPAKYGFNRQTYMVLTTRGVPVDLEALPALLDTPHAYLGVIGSKRRWATAARQLQERGVPAEALARVRSPLGLELHAETPEEIAVSIMAEIIGQMRAPEAEAEQQPAQPALGRSSKEAGG
jgi:xanthine dehydrogenase accessory factor